MLFILSSFSLSFTSSFLVTYVHSRDLRRNICGMTTFWIASKDPLLAISDEYIKLILSAPFDSKQPLRFFSYSSLLPLLLHVFFFSLCFFLYLFFLFVLFIYLISKDNRTLGQLVFDSLVRRAKDSLRTHHGQVGMLANFPAWLLPPEGKKPNVTGDLTPQVVEAVARLMLGQTPQDPEQMDFQDQEVALLRSLKSSLETKQKNKGKGDKKGEKGNEETLRMPSELDGKNKAEKDKEEKKNIEEKDTTEDEKEKQKDKSKKREKKNNQEDNEKERTQLGKRKSPTFTTTSNKKKK